MTTGRINQVTNPKSTEVPKQITKKPQRGGVVDQEGHTEVHPAESTQHAERKGPLTAIQLPPPSFPRDDPR
jgi:hypothetical protein